MQNYIIRYVYYHLDPFTNQLPVAMWSTLMWSTCHESNSTSQMLSKAVPLVQPFKRMLWRLPPMPWSHGEASLHNRIHGRKYQYS